MEVCFPSWMCHELFNSIRFWYEFSVIEPHLCYLALTYSLLTCVICCAALGRQVFVFFLLLLKLPKACVRRYLLFPFGDNCQFVLRLCHLPANFPTMNHRSSAEQIQVHDFFALIPNLLLQTSHKSLPSVVIFSFRFSEQLLCCLAETAISFVRSFFPFNDSWLRTISVIRSSRCCSSISVFTFHIPRSLFYRYTFL